jgi:hypothetical protein
MFIVSAILISICLELTGISGIPNLVSSFVGADLVVISIENNQGA